MIGSGRVGSIVVGRVIVNWRVNNWWDNNWSVNNWRVNNWRDNNRWNNNWRVNNRQDDNRQDDNRRAGIRICENIAVGIVRESLCTIQDKCGQFNFETVTGIVCEGAAIHEDGIAAKASYSYAILKSVIVGSHVVEGDVACRWRERDKEPVIPTMITIVVKGTV